MSSRGRLRPMELQWSIGAAVTIGMVGGLVGLVAFIGGLAADGELGAIVGFVLLLVAPIWSPAANRWFAAGVKPKD